MKNKRINKRYLKKNSKNLFKNGYNLINDIYNADDYIQKIIELYKRVVPEDQANTNKRILSERSFERYKNSISKLLR